MTEDRRTALVVLKPGLGRPASPQRVGETPPAAETVDRVLAWFRSHGFETGPFVGVSFAISGGDEIFERLLGTAHPVDEHGGELAYPLNRLDEEIRPLVAAVVLPAPPDFGPGSP